MSGLEGLFFWLGVFGLLFADFWGGWGVARYVLAEPHELALKPPGLSYQESAAVPLSVLTAWQALVVHGGLVEGQSVLILGAAGGVGSLAVQLAVWRGARVTGTCSEGKMEFVKSLGAHEVVDYNKSKAGRDFDIVLDCVGGETQDEGFEHVKEGGILVTVPEPVRDKGKSYLPKIRSKFFIVEPSGKQLEEMRPLIENIKNVVGRVYALKDGAAAFDELEKGHSRGKTVLMVSDE